jgi:4-amino-4-deoxy-L-arabinose transferase-like glycosyltransferase
MESTSPNQPFYKTWWMTFLIILLFIAAMGIRLFDLTDLPNDFYMVRQYRGLVIARGMYYSISNGVEEWQREFAVNAWKKESLIEPPILEGLVAITYRLIGERIWLGRFYSSLFWIIGGLGIWFLARDLGLKHGGLIALAYYLFLPFGVIASRTMMPDPLMVSLMVWSIWALHRWEMKPSWGNAILAGVFTGAAILVKSVIVFPLLGAAAALVFSRCSIKKIFRDGKTWLVVCLAILPTLLYYLFGLFVDESLRGQFSLRFFPDMLTDPSFYGKWLFLMAGITGWAALFISLAGFLLFRTRQIKFMFVGLWIGYLIYGLIFPYHFLTHEYYHLPLLPVIAIGLIPSAQAFIDQLTQWMVGGEKKSFFWYKFGVTGILFLAVAMNLWDARNTMVRDSYRHEVSYWSDLGQLLGHDKQIIELSGDYGFRLSFFGWVDGRLWPMVADLNLRELAGQESEAFNDMFTDLTEGMDYFVITSLPEFKNQPELGDYLDAHFPIISQGDGYIIYNLGQ